MPPIGKEATDFVRAYECIYGLLAQGALSADDRDLTEFICLDLLNKLKPTPVVKFPVQWQ